MGTGNTVLATVAVVAGALGIAGCDVEKKTEGDVTLPKYEVKKVQEGNVTVPTYEVTGPDVTVKEQKVEVTVPEVVTKKETITVPNIDVKTGSEKKAEGR